MDGRNQSSDVGWFDLHLPSFYASSAAIFAGVRVLVYPPLLVKTRLMMQQRQTGGQYCYQYRSTADAFRQIARAEGLRALYRGFGALMAGSLPAQFAYITVYERIRALPAFRSAADDAQLPAVARLEMQRNFVAGAAASLSSSLLAIPTDIVTQRLQAQSSLPGAPQRYRDGRDVVRQILNADGVRGLYRGYFFSVCVYIPSSATFWAVYSSLRAAQREYIAHQPALVAVPLQALSGVTAGLVSSSLSNPLDVIRTNLQTATDIDGQRPTVARVVRQLWRTDSARFMVKGLAARVLANAPISCLLVVAYERIKQLSLVDH